MTGPPIPPEGSQERTMALVSYIATWLTGLIILLISEKHLKYQRWNAIQAIGFGIVFVVLVVIVQVILVGAMIGGGAKGAGFALVGTLLTLGLWGLFIVIWILLMVRAYKGSPIRLPVLADFADRNA